jgi:hypothetical protein
MNDEPVALTWIKWRAMLARIYKKASSNVWQNPDLDAA